MNFYDIKLWMTFLLLFAGIQLRSSSSDVPAVDNHIMCGTKLCQAPSPSLTALDIVVFKSSFHVQVFMALKVGQQWLIRHTVEYWTVFFILLSAQVCTFPAHNSSSLCASASLWDCFSLSSHASIIKVESADCFAFFFIIWNDDGIKGLHS